MTFVWMRENFSTSLKVWWAIGQKSIAELLSTSENALSYDNKLKIQLGFPHITLVFSFSQDQVQFPLLLSLVEAPVIF